MPDSGLKIGGIRFTLGSLVMTLSLILLHASIAFPQQGLTEQLALVSELDRRGDYDRALEVLRPLLRDNPDHYDILCWMAEILVDKSEVVARASSQREAKPICQEAVSCARRAVELLPDGAEGWFQVGQATGNLSQLPGGRETVDLAHESKSAFEKAISLDPNHTGALHGLGRWHRSVANLSGAMKLAAKIFYGGLPKASNKEAVRLFESAISLEPDVIIHHLELGKTYLEMRKKDLARSEFETVLRLPVASYFDTSRKEEARQLLGRLR